MTGIKYFLFVLLIGGVSALNPLAIDAFIPAMPEIAKDLAVDPGTVGITLGLYTLGTAVGQVIFGPLADRFGRRPMLVIGLVIYIAASIASAFATTITVLALLRTLHGVAAASGRVIATAIVRDLFEREQAGKLMGYMFAVVSAMPIFGPLIGSELINLFGWEAIFIYMAVVSGAIFLAVWFGLKETLPTPDYDAIRPAKMAINFGEILSNRTFLAYMLCHSLAASALYSFLATSADVIINTYGESTRYFAIGFAAIMTSGMLGSLAGGRMVTRFGIDRLILTGTIVTCSSGLVLLAAALLDSATPIVVIVLYALYKFADSAVNPQSAAGAMTPFRDMAGAASSLLGFIRQGVGALTAVIIGALADGTSVPLAAGIAFAGTSALLIRVTLIRNLTKR